MALPLFPARIRFVDANGFLTREAVAAWTGLWERTGGIDAPTNTELVQSDDDDSGLEEFKHEASKWMDGLFSAPPQMEQQRVEDIETQLSSAMALIAELRKELEDMKQGQML
jgi:hypothetical protein